jgi:hypothetical protein
VFGVIAVSPARAQRPAPLAPTIVNSDFSAVAALADLGSNFPERTGDQATGGSVRAFRSNPAGGGASQAAKGPQFRTWTKAYEISTRTGPRLDFVGDQRQTTEGVAGIGAR